MKKMKLRGVNPAGALLLALFLSIFQTGNISGSDTPEPPLISMDRDHADVGEIFTVSVKWQGDGALLLESGYPSTSSTWILEPVSRDGSNFEFEMPGPYARGNISLRILYALEGEDGVSSYTEDMLLPITGWNDTDLDGLDDSWEEKYGVENSEIDPDPDEDGLDLMAEMYNLTDPGKKDSDGDSMDDLWESAHGTLPFKDDPNDDPDRDGWSNVREKNRGTDPRDPEDHPEEPPVTPWYWTLIIVGVLLLILFYFVKQLFSRRRLEDDMEDFDTRSRKPGGAENMGKTGKL